MEVGNSTIGTIPHYPMCCIEDLGIQKDSKTGVE